MISGQFAISRARYIMFQEKISLLKQDIDAGLLGKGAINPDLLDKGLGDIINSKFYNLSNDKILKRISTTPQNLTIKFINGPAVIANAKEIFNQGIDKDFKRFGLTKSNLPSPDIAVNVYQIARDSTDFQMYNSLSLDFNELVLTQSQIIGFCVQYPQYLQPKSCGGIGGTASFLLKAEDEIRQVVVSVYSEGLHVSLDIVDDERMWHVTDDCRIVVPLKK